MTNTTGHRATQGVRMASEFKALLKSEAKKDLPSFNSGVVVRLEASVSNPKEVTALTE